MCENGFPCPWAPGSIELWPACEVAVAAPDAPADPEDPLPKGEDTSEGEDPLPKGKGTLEEAKSVAHQTTHTCRRTLLATYVPKHTCNVNAR